MHALLAAELSVDSEVARPRHLAAGQMRCSQANPHSMHHQRLFDLDRVGLSKRLDDL